MYDYHLHFSWMSNSLAHKWIRGLLSISLTPPLPRTPTSCTCLLFPPLNPSSCLSVLGTLGCLVNTPHPPPQQNTDLDRCVHLWGWTEGLSYTPLHLDIQYNHSVQFTCSVMSESLRPHGLQHTRPPCPSPTPGVYSNSCPLSQWCHPTVSYSVVPFSSCLHSFPASESFQMRQFFASGGQRIEVSASALVRPMNIQNWFPSGWTGWFSLKSKGLSRVFSNTTVQKHQFFGTQLSLWFTSHIHTWLLEKP